MGFRWDRASDAGCLLLDTLELQGGAFMPSETGGGLLHRNTTYARHIIVAKPTVKCIE